MARKNCRAPASAEQTLTCLRTHCGCCSHPMAVAYRTQRTITTLQGSYRLILRVRRCRNPACAWYHRAFRPEEEGEWALPHGDFGLDVIALVGTLRYSAHRSVPGIHQALHDRGVPIAERTVTHFLQRYEELVALHLGWATLDPQSSLGGLARRSPPVVSLSLSAGSGQTSVRS